MGGGGKSRLCVLYRVCQNSALNSAYRSLNSLCQSLHSNLSLYILLFTFFTFLRLKFLLIASECQKIQCIVIANERIARAWQSIVLLYKFNRTFKFAVFIDCHAKNRSRSFLLAMTGAETFAMTARHKFKHSTKQLFINFIQIFIHTFSHFKQLFILFTQISIIFAQFLLINFTQGAKNG